MDLGLYLRVLWRFRLLVASGVILGLGLAFLSMVRVGADGFSYREEKLWIATSRLLVTQQGFPEGRATADAVDPGLQAEKLGVRFAPPDRFTSLAVLYAKLATSDSVRRIASQQGPLRGTITAVPVVAEQNVILPMIDVGGIAASPKQALSVSERATRALAEFLTMRQIASDVPAGNRVVVQSVAQPRKAVVFQDRSKTLPIVVLLTVLIATIGLAATLENLRPRVRPLPESADVSSPSAVRRSA
jgi:hypothetical protein